MPLTSIGAVGTTLPRKRGGSGPMKAQEIGVSVGEDNVRAGLPLLSSGGHFVCFSINPLV